MEFLRSLAELRTPFWDSVFSAVTFLGEETVAIIGICLIYWCISKKLAYGIGASYFFANIASLGLKLTFRVERPWVIDPDFKAVESALAGADDYSFPSGHAAGATAMYGTIGLSVKKTWAKVLAFAMIPAVAFSRLYLGVHTPLDVTVGVLAAAAITVAVFWAVVRENSSDKAASICALVLVAASVALIIFGVAVFSTGAIEKSHVSNCCKTAGASIGFAAGMWLERRYINFEENTDKFWKQLVKYAVGLAVLVGLKSGLKVVIGESLVADCVRYFVIIFWAIAAWPACFKKLFPTKAEEITE